MVKLNRYDVLLRERIRPEDKSWDFLAEDLPSSCETKAAKLIKQVTLGSPSPDEHACIRLKLIEAPSNRITRAEPLDTLLLLSAADFRITHDAKEPNGNGRPPVEMGTGRESADYLTRLCQSGLSLNGVMYNFFGHGNSQLKSRSCFFLAGSKKHVDQTIEALGDFSKCKTVGKKAKRIGLLFTSGDMELSELHPSRCEDIDDVERDGYVFTDGCGSISPVLARKLVQRKNITFRGKRYLPSVFQIRYRGYKGVLTLDPSLLDKGRATLVRFRESMRKFKDAKDLSFSVIDYAKPYVFGHLNDEIVLLLHSLGISTQTLKRKQDEHIEFLHLASSGHLQEAFRFLCLSGRIDLSERLLLDGIDSVLESVKSLVKKEYAKMVKGAEQKCRIQIPKSRLMFGVCDPAGTNGNRNTGHLRAGECFVRITNGNGEPVTVFNADVLVTRSPCLHPGDLQKFRAVNVPELAHLVDCIVFSTAGKRPSADLMSGGDLDGDKFFVTWDPDIVPRRLCEPAEYPAVPERGSKFKTGPITGDDRAEYFARYHNPSMGRFAKLRLAWARVKGPLSPECQELNRLYSQAVDGNRIKLPLRLENPQKPKPKPEEGKDDAFVFDELHAAASPECQKLDRSYSQAVGGNRIKLPLRLENPQKPKPKPKPEEGNDDAFVLDELHAAAKQKIQSVMVMTNDASSRPEDRFFDPTELCLSRQDVDFALSEFELIELTLRWCAKNGADFSQYTPYFNFGALSEEQQAWVLSQLGRIKPGEEFASLVRNGLLQSQLVHATEWKSFQLHHAGLHWKCVFDSSKDRLGRFLPTLGEVLESFHKKLVVWRADDRLTLAMYIPQQVERAADTLVGARVRVFALPRSKGTDSPAYRVLPTKVNYRIYSDDGLFQLYDNTRANTWVFLGRGPMNDESFRNATSERDRRHQQQKTMDEGVNFDCRSSVALDKMGRGIQTHVGRMNRAGVFGAEIYVISNRDVKSLQLLDLWLDHVDTEHVHPLFEDQHVPYIKPRLAHLDLSNSKLAASVATFFASRDVEKLAELGSIDEVSTILSTLDEYDEKLLLREVYRWLLDHDPGEEGRYERCRLVSHLLNFLPTAAYLTLVFLESDAWATYKDSLQDELDFIALAVVRQLILLSNQMRAFVRLPLKLLMQEMKRLSVQNLAGLIELVALSLHDPDNALDLLVCTIEPELGRLLVDDAENSDDKILADRVSKALIGLALDHIDEASEGRILPDKLKLRLDGESEGYQVVKSDILNYSKLHDLLRTGDHVRLSVSQPAENAPVEPRCVVDAVVIGAQPASGSGSASFRCLHRLPGYFEQCVWHLAHCGSFVTTRTAMDAVAKFYGEKDLCCGLFAPLVGIRGSSSSMSRHEQVNYIKAENLNERQNEALEASLTQPLTFLWGPPGTGKTHTIVTILLNLLDGLPKQRILVAAPTHNAVDNIVQKFIKEKGIERSGVQPLRVSTEVGKVALDIRPFTCDAMVGKDVNEDQRARNQAQKRVKESRLVFTTCTGAGLGLLRSETFPIVVVDEASQLTEPATLIPLVKACQRAVLVGDHKQLRATVRKHAAVVDLDVSLFERLYDEPQQTQPVGFAKVMLNTQYRMHRDVCTFASEMFYHSNLLTGVHDADRPLAHCRFPWPPNRARKLFVPCPSPEDVGYSSKANRGQAELCRLVCETLTTPPPPPPGGHGGHGDQGDVSRPPPFETSQIAVLTPYTRQKALLATLLPSSVTVSSIDGYQGKEADVVVFVTVRCNPRGDMGFLADLRRLNVAMTRARRLVVVIGNRHSLAGTALPEVPGGRDGEADHGREAKACWRGLIDSCTLVEFPVG